MLCPVCLKDCGLILFVWRIVGLSCLLEGEWAYWECLWKEALVLYFQAEIFERLHYIVKKRQGLWRMNYGGNSLLS